MKRIIILTMICLGLSGLPRASWAQGKISQAPLKPVSGIPSKFGLLQAPIDMSHLVPPITVLGHPSSWDWRSHAGVTPVKDQNPYGSCWAFAATGSIESRALLDEAVTYDFAEMELVKCNHSGLTCDSGGNDWYSTFYYSLHGTAQESCNPYVSCSSATCRDCPWIKQITEWQNVCDSPNPAAIKEALYNIGPVSTMMYASNPKFSSYNGTTVLYGTTTGAVDHVVLIVGYDDNMVHAGGTGAWIVKNSWGTSWGDNGYFYIAYGSWSIGTQSSVYSGYRNYPANQKVMTYENDVPWSALGYGDYHDWGAVRFTPTMTGNLTHVGFWARATGTSYTIKIYDNWNNGSPTVQKNTTQSGTLTRAGYYSIQLTSPVPVTNGDEIVIIIEITTPGYAWPIPLDTASPFETNKSYISDTGANGTWQAVDSGSLNYGDFAFRAFIVPAVCTYHQKLGADLRVTSNASYSGVPSLAWTGSEFGVSWKDTRDDGNFEIYFARVSSSGAKLGSEFRVTSAAGYSEDPSLAWTGSEFGVSWFDTRDGNSEIYFARVSSAGAKLGSDLRVTSNASGSDSASLAWTGSEFGVSLKDLRDGNYEIYFARVSSSGSKLGSDLRVTSNAYYSEKPSLAWTGSEFGVSWMDGRDGNYEIYFARVSASGAKLGSDLRVTSNASNSYFPSLAWTGSEFGVSWNDYRDGNYEIYFARVSSAGAKLGSEFRVTNDAVTSAYPSLSWTGSEFGVSWEDYRDGNTEIYFARVSSAGAKLGADLRVTSAASYSEDTSLAWTGSEFGVSWEDYRDGNYEIYFARIGCGNCNLTSLDIIPVASVAGGNINLAEGATVNFTSGCTYIGSTCGALSDNCGQGQGVNWNYAGQVSLSAPGPSTSTVATAGQIPCSAGGSGQVSGSATYGAGSYSDSTNLTITNNDTVSTVDVTPNSTVTLAEGGSQLFQAKATFNDACTEQVACGGLLGATAWTVTGNLTAGGCASSQKTISANQIPCGAGGSGTVNATYQTKSDAAASAVTVTNNDSLTGVTLTPPGPLSKDPAGAEDFYCLGSWNDGCTNSETNPKGTAPVYSLGQNQSGASINSSSGLYTAGAVSPAIDSAVCTISGLSDGTTIAVGVSGDSDGDGLPNDWENSYFCMEADTVDNLADYDGDGLNNEGEYVEDTDPCDPDSDADGIWDGFEFDHPLCLNPLDPNDALADGDTDGLANIHEFVNNNGDGNINDPCVKAKPKKGAAGGGYFGDADGDLVIGVPDMNVINLKLNGRLGNYSNVFPADPVIQDLDGDLVIGIPDKNILSVLLSGRGTDYVAGSPTELTLVEPAVPPTKLVGDTVRIKVKLTKDGTKQRAGFGVVFTVVSGSGTLLGGEGISGSGRYDLTALDGVAQMVVKVTGSVTPIRVQVNLPYDAEVHTRAITGPEALINVGP